MKGTFKHLVIGVVRLVLIVGLLDSTESIGISVEFQPYYEGKKVLYVISVGGWDGSSWRMEKRLPQKLVYAKATTIGHYLKIGDEHMTIMTGGIILSGNL